MKTLGSNFIGLLIQTQTLQNKLQSTEPEEKDQTFNTIKRSNKKKNLKEIPS